MPTNQFLEMKTKAFRDRQNELLLKHTHPMLNGWGKSHLKKICNHLIQNGGDDAVIGKRILRCGEKGEGYCGSIFCKRCSHRLADKMCKRWKGKIDETLPTYSATLLGGVVAIDAAEISDAVEELRSRMQKVKKSTPFPFMFDGFVEFEVIDTPSFFTPSSYSISNKRKQQFVKKYADRNHQTQPTLIPHIHSIFQIPNEALLVWYKRLLQKYFGKQNEVLVKKAPFFGQSMDEGLERWSSYIFKSNNTFYSQKFVYKNHFDAQLFAKTDAQPNHIDFHSLISFLRAHYLVSGGNNKGLQITTNRKTDSYDWKVEDFV